VTRKTVKITRVIRLPEPAAAALPGQPAAATEEK